MVALSREEIEAAYNSDDPELQRMVYAYVTSPYYTFQPRPDNVADHDEQTAFVESKEKFAILLGGTGSGKTEAAAYKTAKYILETTPPRSRLPFWVIGETYELTCGVCWGEKLSRYIPTDQIAGISWKNENRNWPLAVMLWHPTKPGEIGWILEFKSYAQGRERMQAASIGGYWFNEEVPIGIVEEVQGRCRDYDSPGWADFTPIEIRSPEWIEKYQNPPQQWRFFHLNSLRNTSLPDGWAERYLSTVPEDIRPTRQIGVFTSLRGQVFKEWRLNIHVIDPIPLRDCRRLRAIDFGFTNPFCCLWIARDYDGCYYVYDEHYESERLHDYHVEQINKRSWDYSSPLYGRTYSDHDPQERAELAARGIETTPARKNIQLGLEKLRSLMMVRPGINKPRLFVFSNCKNLIWEIPRYRWPEGTDTRNPTEGPIDKDNHAIDALRYGIYTEEVNLIPNLPSQFKVKRPARSHGILIANGNGRR